MRRIAVIGSSTGSGKTTFGRALAERLGLPFAELDALAWGPNWTLIPTDEFRARVTGVLDGGRWVIDGNYTGRLKDLVWRQADTIVWLDLPLRVALWRTLRRTLGRIRSGEALWSGNRESLWNAFASRDSLFVYAVRTYRRRRRIFEERLRGLPDVTVHRFRSSAEASRWLSSLDKGPDAGSPAGSRQEAGGQR